MSSNSKLIAGISQIILILIVIYGYLMALIPFNYYNTLIFGLPGVVVVPFRLIISSIIAYQSNNKTTRFIVVNLLMSFLVIIPLLGYLAIFSGLIISLVVGLAILPSLLNRPVVDVHEKVNNMSQDLTKAFNKNGVVNKYPSGVHRNGSVDVETVKSK